MATTTNYSWTTPDDTDLVKDGASAIRSLGSAIDSTVFTNAGNAINKTIVDAKGDLIAATAADTVGRLAVGTNGQVLKANSATATGLEWGSAGGLGWTQVATGSLTGASVSVTGLGSKEYMLAFDGWSHDDVTNRSLNMTFNSYTGTNYVNGNTNKTAANIQITGTANSSSTLYSTCFVLGAGDTEEIKMVLLPVVNAQTLGGTWWNSSAVTSIQFFPSAGNFDAGTYYIYGRG
jgi:hypothetical protein